MAMARDGLLPSFFSDINQRTQVPVKSTIATGIGAAVLAFFMDVSQLAGMVSFMERSSIVEVDNLFTLCSAKRHTSILNFNAIICGYQTVTLSRGFPLHVNYPGRFNYFFFPTVIFPTLDNILKQILMLSRSLYSGSW